VATRPARRGKRPAARRKPVASKSTSKIQPLSMTDLNRRFMFYSEPGAGKSALISSSVELGPTLIMNADRPDSLDIARELGYKPDVWEFNNYSDLDEVYEFFRHGGTKEYDWFWLDTGTIAQDKAMDQIMRELVAGNPNRSLYLPDKPQYQLNQNHLATWVRNMSKLKVNFGITAHVMSTFDADEEVHYMPAFQGGRGALSQRLCANVGTVGRLYTTRVRKEAKGGKKKTVNVRALQVQPTGKYYAKGPIGLGNEVTDPTMAKLMEAIQSRRSSK
jgi:hypothetical protein